MNYDNSIDALIKPGSSQHYFQFDTLPQFFLNSPEFEISNACLLAELSRLVYRNDEVIYSGNKKISFLNTVLNAVHIEWIDCLKHDEHSVYSYLFKINAYDLATQKNTDCLLLIFRGSTGFDNWKLNAKASLETHPISGKVHKGFLKAFESIQKKISRSEDLYKYPVILAGHSLGAALAILTLAEFQTSFKIDSCYTFGAPKVGNKTFVDSLNVKNIYRIINRNDIITMLPFEFINSSYQHVGESHYFTEDKHYIGYLDDNIYGMQQNDLPNIQKLRSIEQVLMTFKNLERDIPTYLSDHAPINYLARLNKQLQSR